jgi:hypothetical protein
VDWKESEGAVWFADYLIHQKDDEMTLIDNHGVDRDALGELKKSGLAAS